MRDIYFKNGASCEKNEKFLSAGTFIAAAFATLLMVFTASVVQAQTVAALPVSSNAIMSVGAAKPLQGWSRFCESFPAECAVDVTEPEIVELTPQIWKNIVSVNQRVNTSIKAVTDADHFGIVDIWGFPDDGRGDCEDFQLLKRRILVENGLPRRAMRMAVVIDELGEGHAVLVVRTNRGDYILDNKTSSILPWGRTGYVYIKRESQDMVGWVSLGGIATSPTTTANP
jgi:predicted transglutaminase-like cysteine proteinase